MFCSTPENSNAFLPVFFMALVRPLPDARVPVDSVHQQDKSKQSYRKHKNSFASSCSCRTFWETHKHCHQYACEGHSIVVTLPFCSASKGEMLRKWQDSLQRGEHERSCICYVSTSELQNRTNEKLISFSDTLNLRDRFLLRRLGGFHLEMSRLIPTRRRRMLCGFTQFQVEMPSKIPEKQNLSLVMPGIYHQEGKKERKTLQARQK